MLFVFVSRCLFYSPISGSSQANVPTDEQLREAFEKDLIMNVFRNGEFGSFRHIPFQSG